MKKLLLVGIMTALLLNAAAVAEQAEAADETVDIEQIEIGSAYTEMNYRDKGSAVQALQQRLNDLGYSCGTPDGQFGSKTRIAVGDFQKRNGLDVTGVADAETQTVLYSENAVPAVTVPDVYVANVTKNNDYLAVTVANDSKDTVTSVTCVYITQNPDGSLSSNCGHPGEIAYFDQEAWSFEWQLGETIEPGAVVSAVDDSPVDPTRHWRIACGVKAYTTASGDTVSFAYEQIPFLTNTGEMIYPVDESGAIRTATAEELAQAYSVKFGYSYKVIPYYAAAYYLLPAGHYITSVEDGSLAQQAGLQAGDILVSFGGDPATYPYAAEYAKLKMAKGENVYVEYVRNNESIITFLAFNSGMPDAQALSRYASLLENNYITQAEYNVLVEYCYNAFGQAQN